MIESNWIQGYGRKGNWCLDNGVSVLLKKIPMRRNSNFAFDEHLFKIELKIPCESQYIIPFSIVAENEFISCLKLILMRMEKEFWYKESGFYLKVSHDCFLIDGGLWNFNDSSRVAEIYQQHLQHYLQDNPYISLGTSFKIHIHVL